MTLLSLVLHTLLCLVVSLHSFEAICKMDKETAPLAAFAYCGMFCGFVFKMVAVFAPFFNSGQINATTLSQVQIPPWEMVAVAALAAFHVVEARKWRAGVPEEYRSDWGKLHPKAD
jgi:hypothetical protein